jgi:hypothetical protein
MWRVIFGAFFILLLPLLEAGQPAKNDLGAKLVKRSVDLAGDSGAYIHDIPPSPRREEPGLARHLADSLIWYRQSKHRGKHDPAIVISDDPALGARVAHVAFSSLRAGSLHGLRVICIVGKRYDAYLHDVADATGVKLEVEPLPK